MKDFIEYASAALYVLAVAVIVVALAQEVLA